MEDRCSKHWMSSFHMLITKHYTLITPSRQHNNLAQLMDDATFQFQILHCCSLQHKTSHNTGDEEEMQGATASGAAANVISINVAVSPACNRTQTVTCHNATRAICKDRYFKILQSY